MKKIKFDSEYTLHKLTEKNLCKLFDFEFVASERQCDGLRVDNLAFDKDTETLVIIEYKNKKNFTVIEQAKSYLEKAKEKPEVFGKRLKDKKEYDFKDIRVMIISPEFTQDQLNNNEEDIELWQVSLYDDGKVSYENMKTNDDIKELNIDLADLDFTEQKTLKDKPEENIKLYDKFKEKVMDKYNDSIDFRYLVDAVSFRTNNQIVCIFHLSNKPKIHYFTDKLIDCENKTRDISEITTGGKANYELVLSSESDIDYAFDLFEQVYLQKNEE